MPAPEAVPCWVSEDDDWLQAGTEIIEQNAKVTMNVTSRNWLRRPLCITYDSSFFSGNGNHRKSCGYNKFVSECKPPAVTNANGKNLLNVGDLIEFTQDVGQDILLAVDDGLV